MKAGLSELPKAFLCDHRELHQEHGAVNIFDHDVRTVRNVLGVTQIFFQMYVASGLLAP